MQEKINKPFYKKKWVIVTGIIVVLYFIGSASEKQTQTNQVSNPIVQKQYQEVFTFKGNGAKKSEPFTIQGDRFKISYDCKANPSVPLCMAFIYKVGSSLPQALMNSQQSIKDETVIYSNLAGKGEYYIDVNTLGSYTMTVYDYK